MAKNTVDEARVLSLHSDGLKNIEIANLAACSKQSVCNVLSKHGRRGNNARSAAADRKAASDAGLKYCPTCKLSKSPEVFHNNKYTQDGLSIECKECRVTASPHTLAYRSLKAKHEPLGEMPCYKCLEVYPMSDFRSYSNYCPECRFAHNKKHYNAEKARDSNRKLRFRSHGISEEIFEIILDQQYGICAICGRHPDVGVEVNAIDHDHRCCPGKFSCGGCIRGILCCLCNTALGMFGDSPETVRSAADYLDRWKGAWINGIPHSDLP